MMLRIGNEFYPLASVERVRFDVDGTATVSLAGSGREMRVSIASWVTALRRQCEEMRDRAVDVDVAGRADGSAIARAAELAEPAPVSAGMVGDSHANGSGAARRQRVKS